ncbi:hypothetical protein ACFL1S_03490 [Pseudomonadota bacterium]
MTPGGMAARSWLSAPNGGIGANDVPVVTASLKDAPRYLGTPLAPG